MLHTREDCTIRPWGRPAAGLVLAVALLLAGRDSARHHRFHARVQRERPAAVAPMPGVRQIETRRWPFVPVTADPVPSGWFYAVTPAEVAAALDGLPEGWRAVVEGVRLCPSPDGDVSAETDGEVIQLHYMVDRKGRALVPPDEDAEEEREFGGVPSWDHGRLWVLWPRHDLLQTYVLKHLLIHEIGHHLAPEGLDDDADERWAEEFAYRFYDPTHPRAFDRQAAASLY